MRLRLVLLGTEVFDFATGRDVIDEYEDAEPAGPAPIEPIWSVFGCAQSGLIDRSADPFGFQPHDGLIPEFDDRRGAQ